MGQYKLRDAFSLPGLISLTRVPLALSFWFTVDPWSKVAIMSAAGLSDVLDGWIARRTNTATATGAALDPVTDKLFVTTVVVSLIRDHLLPWWAILVLSIRDLAELPLVGRFVLSREARRRRAEYPKANVGGKLATAAQFVAVTAAMLGSPHTLTLLVVAGVVGTFAAVGYWQSELAATRAQP